jgi:protein TonB
MTVLASLALHAAPVALFFWVPIDTSGTLERPTDAISVNIVDSSVLESMKPSEESEAAAQQASAASDPGQAVEEDSKAVASLEQFPLYPPEPRTAPEPTRNLEATGEAGSKPPPASIETGATEAALPDEPALVRVPEPIPLGPRDLTALVREAVERDQPAERKDESEPSELEHPRRTLDNEARIAPGPSQEHAPSDEKRRESRKADHRGGAPARASAGQSRSSAAVAASRGDLSGYAALVRARVAAHKPSGSGVRGTVTIRFGVSRSGAISFAAIASSSGNAALDRAALSAVHQAAPFPAPPGGAGVTFAVPFTFQ